jgi:hypothetical protein
VEAFWKAQDPLLWIQETTPGQQVVLGIYKTTSCAVWTGVTNPQAAQEVNTTNMLELILSSGKLRFFSLMHLLKKHHLQNTIVVVYSKG